MLYINYRLIVNIKLVRVRLRVRLGHFTEQYFSAEITTTHFAHFCNKKLLV